MSARLWALLAGVGFLMFGELANHYWNYLLLWEALAVLLVAVICGWRLRQLKKQGLSVHHLAAVFVALLFGEFGLRLFADRALARHMLLILTSLLIYLNLYYLGLFAAKDKNYPIGGLEQVNLGILGWSVFLLATSFFGWTAFLARSFWPILAVAGAVFFAIFLELFFLRKIEIRAGVLPALLLAILSIEFFWAISLLPVGFVSKGLVFSVIMLYLAYLAQSFLLKQEARQQRLIYGAITVIVAAAALGMARWV